MRILIADDDPDALGMLEMYLESWGHDVVTASTGDEAWAVLSADDPPMLVTLDWMMPGLEGPELCRKVRARETARPPYIILMTAMKQKRHIVEGLKAGANDYIGKPYDSEEVRARLLVGQRVLELQASLADRVAELERAAAHIRRLQGIIPICMYCKRIRNDQKAWERIEEYIQEHSEATFTHGICPECAEEHFPGSGA